MRTSDNKIKNGLVWNSVNYLVKYGLQFGSVMILARLLSPHDYGLIGLITIFITVSEVICDSGLAGALIKKKDALKIDFSTLFVYSTVVSLVLFVVLFFCAPLLDDFYNEDCLGSLLRLYSVVLILDALAIVPRTYMIKKFMFKKLSIITTSSSLLGIMVAILLAYFGYGPYSIVWQYIVCSFFFNVFVRVTTNVRLGLEFSLSSFKEQFAFGINTTVANVLKSVTENLFNNIIGKSTSVLQAGYYTQGFKIMQVPVTFFMSLVDSTYFPVLSQIHDKTEFCNKIRDLNIKTLGIIILIFTFLIPNSKEIIYILLGENWLDCEWTLTILFISGLFITWGNIGRNVIKCTGKTFLILIYEIVVFLLAMIGLFFTYKLGYDAIVLCFLIISIIKSLVINYIGCKELQISVWDSLKPLCSSVISLLAICLILSFVSIDNIYLSLVVKFSISMIGLFPLIWMCRYNIK
ncbi:MAG: lipopolysaccharide biosynthesis protein [Bacteroidales bacterium]|nr:lipopolysaccharide biosynthesis protein [Bacteroidales bacterium]